MSTARNKDKPTVIAHLAVDDFDTWHAEYEQMHPVRQAHGERGRTLYRDADDPNRVVVLFDWDSLDNARAYFTSSALQHSVTRARGRGTPDVRYLEPA